MGAPPPTAGGMCHQRWGLERSPGSIGAEAEVTQTCGDPVQEPQHHGCSSVLGTCLSGAPDAGNVPTPRVSTGCQVGDTSTHASV